VTEQVLLGFASILILGIGARWLAWWLRLPAILLLLACGLIAGPVTGWIVPDALFGALFLPVVSLSVAVILFEGGLSLRMRDLPQIGRVLRRLVSLGVVVTWAISTIAAHVLIGLDLSLAVLLGAILVVTGPTVIMPLLRDIRPTGQVGPILRWEGIVIDPVGATLAVLVFEGIVAGELRQAATLITLGIVKTVAIGGVFGYLGARLLMQLLQPFWAPDLLHNPLALMMVVTVFTAANVLQAESGLLAVTVMGIVLANQQHVSIKHIVEFKENLRVLLISSLFILLAARLRLDELAQIGMGGIGFIVVLVVLARPLSVAFSTLGSDLIWRERLFLAWMAPRGIVAAAVSSIFALHLAEAGYTQAERIVPLTFLVIISTVALYGLTAAPLARRLGLAQANPQGLLIVGAHAWARSIAKVLQSAGCRVLLVDTNWANIAAARMDGLPAHHGSILEENALEELPLEGIGRLIAWTPNDEVNALAALRCAELFGRAQVYQLSPKEGSSNPNVSMPPHLRGRLLFDPRLTYTTLAERLAAGAVVKSTPLTKEFDYRAFQSFYGPRATPFFVIGATGDVTVCTVENEIQPRSGQTLISLVDREEQIRTEAAS
jgi:NhaP-type Na+/H+ or K+/H+ antiporter